MTVTRFMDRDEFEKRMDEMSDYVPVYSLKPVAFIPPCPECGPVGDPYHKKALNVIRLNVAEERLYRLEIGVVIIIPISKPADELSYEYFASIHPEGEKAWGYSLSNALTEVDEWFFSTKVPDFELGKVVTH